MNCKKILALLLTLVMLVTVLPMGALTVSAESTTEFLGGDGTEESPYLISNKTHLNNVRNHRSSHFKMVADIVFTEADFAEKGDYYNNGQGWQPIGTDDVTPFIGVFDGNGHIIKGLYVNILKTNKYIYAGLFGYNEGTIKNLGMLDGSVSATAPSAPSSFYAGGIAGWNYGTISNCYNAGSVSASSSSSSAGGIAGYNDGTGTISNCYNTGSVSASTSSYGDCSIYPYCDSYAGGIAGQNYGTISNCHNAGSASSSVSASSSHSSSYSSYSGGIAGPNHGTISNCYNTGSVSSTSSSSPSSSFSYAGGIAGWNYGTISNCYNTGSASASSYDSYSSSYAGGLAGENDGTIRDCYNTGSVSATSDSISRAGGIAGENDGTISNCYNTGSASASSRVSNPSSSYAGGIAGYNDGTGTISNCYNTGSVSASAAFSTNTYSHSYAGGIAGYNDGTGTISNCYNTGSASASVSSFYTPSSSSSSSYAGGIAGYNREGGTISNCYYLDIIAKGVGGGTGNTVPCTLKEMTQQGTFVGFDFDTVWTMAGNEDYLYPELQNIPIQLKKELVAISVTPPTKTEYLEGKEQLDVTGGKLTLTYNNGTSEVIDLTTDMVSGFDNTKVGKQTLTVTYQGKTTTFEVEIIAVTVPFRDVDKDAYYAAAVDWAVSNEITNGTSDSTFSPDEGCTRAQVVTFLWRAAGKPAPASSTNPFSDVKPGAYYYNAVLWAVEKGITNGTSGTTFSPDETCTRAQIVTFLWRYEEQPAPAGTNNPFADVKPNAYFGSAVLWAVETGITNGTSATTFDPEDTCTRAQVVTFLYRDIVKS